MVEYLYTYNWIFGIAPLVMWSVHFWGFLRKRGIITPFKRQSKYIIKHFVFWPGVIGWCYISFSLTYPRIPSSIEKNNIEVNDIFFVVDVSRSMLANDFIPNRLESSKNKIKEFVDMMPTDRIGIIIFAEKVYTLLPLTTDLDLISETINQIKVGIIGNGTNIGDALGVAVGRAINSRAKNKVLILLTDGVSNVGMMTPVQAAQEAAKNNIKIHTIGVGGKSDALIPIGSGVSGFQKIPGGSIDFQTLRDVSNITNGQSYSASNPKALREVLRTIGQLEKSKVEVHSKVTYKELYLKYLIIGVVLLLVSDLGKRTILREVV